MFRTEPLEALPVPLLLGNLLAREKANDVYLKILQRQSTAKKKTLFEDQQDGLLIRKSEFLPGEVRILVPELL